YARFLEAILKGDGLSPEMADAWMRPNRRVPVPFFSALDPTGDPKLHPIVAWGLGWGLEGETGIFFHWGSNPGFKSFVIGSMRERVSLVVFSSCAAELALVRPLAAAVFPGSRPSLEWFA